MKAKVIETGEIIDVQRLYPTIYSRLDCNGKIIEEYDDDELEFISNKSNKKPNLGNIWHTLDEKPVFPKSDDEPLCSILVLYDNNNMFLYRYGKNGIPNDVTTPHFHSIMNAKWCYCNDLIP